MRCLGCHTVLMDGDTKCPSCGKIQGSGWDAAQYDPVLRSSLVTRKWTIGLIAPILGSLMMLGGGGYLYNARANPPVARTVTGEELAQVEKMEDMPGWIAVMPENTLHTSTMYVKMRSGQPVSKFIL